MFLEHTYMFRWPPSTTYCIVLKTTLVASMLSMTTGGGGGGFGKVSNVRKWPRTVAIEVHLFLVLPLSFHCCSAVSAQ
jgi:hypothetical protein